MSANTDFSHLNKNVRQGTAQRRSGKKTATRILQATYDLLVEGNIETFSMRNVAKRAEISLANLLYYFSSREDLIRALSSYVNNHYAATFEESKAKLPDSPEERFREVLRFCMREDTTPATRRFFIQFWALLGAIDDFEGEYLEKSYDVIIALLSEYIQPMCPDLSAVEVKQRATMIAMLIEGQVLIVGPGKPGNAESEALLQRTFDLSMNIAKGTAL